jgi:hypothetical protein
MQAGPDIPRRAAEEERIPKTARIALALLLVAAALAGAMPARGATSVDRARAALGFSLALPDRWQLLRQDFDETHGLLAEVTDSQAAAYLIIVATAPDPAFATVDAWLRTGEMPIALQYYATDGRRLDGRNYEILSEAPPAQIKVGSGETASLVKMTISADGKPRNIAFISGVGRGGACWYYVLAGNATTPAALDQAIPAIAAGISLR